MLWRFLAVTSIFWLAACSRIEAWREFNAGDEAANTTVPENYRAEILSFMRSYLNDPSQIRDAYISEPVLKIVEGGNRYVVCLRYNAKRGDGRYAGNKDSIMTFRRGRLDHIIDGAREPREGRDIREQCKDVALKPFPELERLTR